MKINPGLTGQNGSSLVPNAETIPRFDVMDGDVCRVPRLTPCQPPRLP